MKIEVKKSNSNPKETPYNLDMEKPDNRKVVHLINRFDIGGLEKVMADTINSLPNYVHIVVVLTEASNESKKLLNDDILIIELHKREGNDFKLWYKFLRLLHKLNPSVLHSYNLPTLEFQMLGFLARVPIRIHAEHGRYASDPHGKSQKYRFYRKLINPLIHYWIPVSMDLKIWLENYISIPNSKIQLIYNGIDTDEYQPASPPLRNRRLDNFASDSDIVLGTIGRLDPVKNQKILIDVFDYIIKFNPELKSNLKLAIVGAGPLKEQLSKHIKSLNLGDHVWLPGARQDIKELLESFDIFILPSIAEGIPITILEAMSMGKPVVATNVGGIPEIIVRGTGILVDPDDVDKFGTTLLSMVSNLATCSRMGENAREHIQKRFSLKIMTDKYNKMYMGTPCAE